METNLIPLDTLRSSGYDAQLARPTRGDAANSLRCIVCGKGVVLSGTSKWVLANETNYALVPIGTEPNCGFFPIGADCARKLPKGYVQ